MTKSGVSNGVFELTAGICLAVVGLVLVLSANPESHETRLKIHIYTDCTYAPLLRLYSVPDSEETYGYFSYDPLLKRYGCAELLLISSTEFKTAEYRDAGERREIAIHPANEASSVYFLQHSHDGTQVMNFIIPKGLVSADRFTSLVLDLGPFDMRERGWKSRISRFVHKSKGREVTRIRFGISGEYEITDSTLEPARIITPEEGKTFEGIPRPSSEYEYHLPGRGSSIVLKVSPSGLERESAILLGVYWLVVAVGAGLIIDGGRRLLGIGDSSQE